MEQFRQVGEVLGGMRSLMVLQHEIQINRSQCRFLLEIFSLAFDTISEEIRQNLRLGEKGSKWKALEQPLREIHRVFREGELYVKQCLDSKDWWGKAMSFHQNRDCVEFHIHNLFVHFPAVIEAVETAGEIAGLDQDEMRKKRVFLTRKYDDEWNDPSLFRWRFGKQYLVTREVRERLESAWKEDRARLVEALRERRDSGSVSLTRNEARLVDLMLEKLVDEGKVLFPSSILLGSKDYQVRRRLGKGGSEYKEIQWLGETFVLRHFVGEIRSLSTEISSLLSLSHPNLVQNLCGFCDEEKNEGFLVVESMSRDLSTHMREISGPRRRRVSLLSLPVAVDLMLQISRGMEYLHSRKIFHGDLNPSNVFVRARNNNNNAGEEEGYLMAKVSGFGLSSVKKKTKKKQLDSQKDSTVEPFIWLAPEVLAEQEQQGDNIPSSSSSLKYSEKADVYSFGMICFELLTGKVPFEDSHLRGEKTSRNIRAGERPLFPHPSPPKYLVTLTRKCWQTDPDLRPGFSSVSRILRYVKKFLSSNPDHQQVLPGIQPPSVDFFGIEARFSKRASAAERCSDAAEIPFQMFSFRVLEKEKTCAASKEGNSQVEMLSDPGSICRDDSGDDVVSLTDDHVAAVPVTDARSVFSEAAAKRASKKSLELKGRRVSVTPKAQRPAQLPLNPCGRSVKISGNGQLKPARNPVRQGRPKSLGHVSE